MTPGVEGASANPTTGNVLIHYNPRLIKQVQVIASLFELGYLEEPALQAPGTAGAAASPGNVLGKVTTAVASMLFEVALTRLMTILIQRSGTSMGREANFLELFLLTEYDPLSFGELDDVALILPDCR